MTLSARCGWMFIVLCSPQVLFFIEEVEREKSPRHHRVLFDHCEFTNLRHNLTA